jgi:hypothetical protein
MVHWTGTYNLEFTKHSIATSKVICEMSNTYNVQIYILKKIKITFVSTATLYPQKDLPLAGASLNLGGGG